MLHKPSLRTALPRKEPRATRRAGARQWVADGKYAAIPALLVFGMFYYMSIREKVWSSETEVDLFDPNPNPYYRAIKIILLLSATGLVIWRYALSGLVLRRVNIFLLAFYCLVALSLSWSITPSSTVLRLVGITNVFLVSCAFTLVSWHDRRFQNVMRTILTLMLVSSLIFGLLWPDLAKENGDSLSLKDAWKGMFTQKNQFGEVASLGVIFWVHAWLSKEVKFLWLIAGGGIATLCLILSKSSTSILSTVFVVLLLLLMLRLPGKRHRYTKYLVMAFVATLLLYSLATLNLVPQLDFLLSPITAITGKDTTFSGRSLIWDIVRERISAHPLLGTGYGAFWVSGQPSSPSYYTLKLLYGVPNESHNGYLDVINDLGLVGLVCLIGYVTVFMRQCLALLKVDFAQATLFLALLFQQLVGNLTESMWLQSTTFAFGMMTVATFALARARVQQQLQGEPARPPPAAPTPMRTIERSRGLPIPARVRARRR
jgi:exopolysaccharide production protein ExoQ